MRKHDWELKLDALIVSRETEPFSRGGHDCALFACDCIEAITGTDPGKWFRGRYKTKRGAASALKKYGGTLAEVADSIMADCGFVEVPPTKAQRGDMVLIEHDKSQALGIVDMSGANIVFADQGLEVGVARTPITNATKAWRVD